jgi:hypothetical protein
MLKRALGFAIVMAFCAGFTGGSTVSTPLGESAQAPPPSSSTTPVATSTPAATNPAVGPSPSVDPTPQKATLEISCRDWAADESADYTSYQEAWKWPLDAQVDCDVRVLSGTASDVELILAKADREDVPADMEGNSQYFPDEDFEYQRELQNLYGDCADIKLGSELKSMSGGLLWEARQYERSLQLCPDHPKRKQIEKWIAGIRRK